MSGPRVTSGADSRQNYATPMVFIDAVEKRFGLIKFDLAAEYTNTVHRDYFGPGSDSGIDSLSMNWHALQGLLWLNPPFNNIARWANKCAAESIRGASIAFLTPASVGSNWARDHVLGKGDVYALSGSGSRLCFDGKNVFPKDCWLAHYHPDALGLFALWDWRRDELTQVWWPDKRATATETA